MVTHSKIMTILQYKTSNKDVAKHHNSLIRKIHKLNLTEYNKDTIKHVRTLLEKKKE